MDNINKPEHYIQGGIETIDFIEAKSFGYHEGNIVKYLTRWRLKGGVEDLKKARWYLDRLIGIYDVKITLGELKDTECFRTPEELEQYLAELNEIRYPADFVPQPVRESEKIDDWSLSHIPLNIDGEPFKYPKGWPYSESGQCNPCSGKGRRKNGTCIHGED